MADEGVRSKGDVWLTSTVLAAAAGCCHWVDLLCFWPASPPSGEVCAARTIKPELRRSLARVGSDTGAANPTGTSGGVRLLSSA